MARAARPKPMLLRFIAASLRDLRMPAGAESRWQRSGGRHPQNHLAENTRFAIALARASALIKPESNEENGNRQKVWPKSADEGRQERCGPCRSGSQYEGKHG